MLCHQKHQGKQNFRLHSPPRKETSIFVPSFTDFESHSVGTFITTRKSSKSPSKEGTRINRWNRNQICVPIFKTINPDNPNKQGPFSRGDPNEKDDDRDDRDDNDEDNDSKPPSIEGISLLLGNNTQWSPTETA